MLWIADARLEDLCLLAKAEPKEDLDVRPLVAVTDLLAEKPTRCSKRGRPPRKRKSSTISSTSCCGKMRTALHVFVTDCTLMLRGPRSISTVASG